MQFWKKTRSQMLRQDCKWRQFYVLPSYQPQHLQVHSRPRMSNRRRPRRRGHPPHPPRSPLPRHRRPPRLQSHQLPQRPTKQEFQGVLGLKFHC